MGMETGAFAPLYVNGTDTVQGGLLESITVSATNSSATASALFPGSIDRNSVLQIQIANKTSAWAHCAFGKYGNIEAATVADDYPVAPGGVVVVTVANEVSGASVILDAAPSSATSVIFTRGYGL